LSAKAEQRARDAIERQQDIERLYTFSRSILLIDDTEPFAKQLARRLVEVFELDAALLYDRRAGEIYRAGPDDFEGMEDQLRDAARLGASFSDAKRRRVITAVRLGSEPIASIALQGAAMPDAVLQGIANLVAIGLERARAQELAREVEVSRQSEQLRTTLIDAMAHELKTPLTAIKAATSSLRSDPGQPAETRNELLAIADEEAHHLQDLIDDSIEMARLDTARIDLDLQPSRLEELLQEALASFPVELQARIEIARGEPVPPLPLDRRLLKLALRQLVDNALKYSTPGTPVTIRVGVEAGRAGIEIANRGEGIPVPEQARIFERFHRSPSVRQQIPGSGLGLSIARSIVEAHKGELSVSSGPEMTTFHIALPDGAAGAAQ
jgi:two-component system sensor histidine kinase KdpD